MKTRDKVIFILTVATLLSAHIEASYFGLYAPKEFLLITCCLLLLAFATYRYFSKVSLPRNNISDWIFLSLFLFFIANTFLFRHQFANTEYLIFISLQFVLYLTFRLSSHLAIDRDQLLLAAMSPLLIEGALSFGQFLGAIPSSNPYFSITGSFNNPGILAGYAAMCLPIALHFFLTLSENHPKRVSYIFSAAILLVAIVILFHTKSRGAMVSAALSCAYILTIHFPVALRFKKLQHMKWIALATAIPVICGLIYYLHSLRPESSSGRLFIWKNTLQIIAKYPMLGVGTGNFSSAYAMIQEQYFSRHDASPHELAIVDSVLVPFNEILGLVAEEGIIGITLVIFFIVYSLKNLNRGEHGKFFSQCVRASILSVFIFSLTSYPSKVIATQATILLLFAVSNSIGPCEERVVVTRKPVSLAAIILVTLVLFGLSFSYFFRTMRTYHRGLLYSHRRDYPKANEFYGQSFSNLKHSSDFLMSYASSLYLSGNYTQSLAILNEFDKVSYSYESTLLRAKNYFAISDFTNAALHLKKASQIVPSRFEPLHLLLLTYEKTGQYDNAVELSSRILDMPVKKKSDQVQKIKDTARHIAAEITKNKDYE
ncbi:O-antigen ligase family protein [Dyadobacter sp. 22481]|uniref:O-antigen ligase family protein n=1 Tax=Dyadobacter sp. 22481 TaxID=3453926 RepID=UPI003F83A041